MQVLGPSQAQRSALLLPQLSALLCQLRGLSVLAWGRNVEHQCGIEGHEPLIGAPTAVLDLFQQPVRAVAAGKLNSGAVVADGEALMFGSGTAGCLGLGSADTVSSPSRIEAFVGRSAINTLTLGQHHTLFVDTGGQLWACGENKEGQCGLGTPLEVLASQHRRAFFAESIPPAASLTAQSRPSPDRFVSYLRAAGAADTPHVAMGWGSLSSRGSSSSSSSSSSPAGPRSTASHGGSSWGRRLGASGLVSEGAAPDSSWSWLTGPEGGWAAGGGGGNDISSLGLWSSAMQAQVSASGAAPGQLHTPVKIRVGQERLCELEDVTGSSCSSGAAEEGQQVISAAASKYYSVVATQKGEVWTFGADYNGALGSDRTWTSSARRVAAPLSTAIADAGGAVAVAAGSTFTAALTSAGRVLVWGKLAGGSPAAPGLTAAAGAASAAAAATEADRQLQSDGVGSMFATVALPAGVKISSISAGQQHLLMSDGERVWVVGRWLNAAAEEVGATSWESPQQVLALPGQGIAKVAAGMHSSAAVTADGQLWLWGRLMDEQHGAGIVRRFAQDMRLRRRVDWGWAGFGGSAPRLVGLEGWVVDVALGGWHALAVVE